MASPSSAPAVRAAHLQEDLAALKALGAGVEAAVRARRWRRRDVGRVTWKAL